MKIEIGQVWKVKEEKAREWRAEVISVTWADNVYFCYKEDVNQQSWHFSLLIDNYNLISNKDKQQ